MSVYKEQKNVSYYWVHQIQGHTKINTNIIKTSDKIKYLAETTKEYSQ